MNNYFLCEAIRQKIIAESRHDNPNIILYLTRYVYTQSHWK